MLRSIASEIAAAPLCASRSNLSRATWFSLPRTAKNECRGEREPEDDHRECRGVAFEEQLAEKTAPRLF